MVNFVFAKSEPDLPFVEQFAHSPQSGYKWVKSYAYWANDLSFLSFCYHSATILFKGIFFHQSGD
jgi:hypothetical protein